MTLEVRILAAFEQIGRAAWDELTLNCPDSTVFQSWGWMRAWWACFATEARSLKLIAVYEDGTLTGLAPLFEEERSTPLGIRRVLRMIGEEHSDYQVFPARYASPLVHHALAAVLEDEVARGTVVELHEMPESSGAVRQLVTRLEGGRRDLIRRPGACCPRIDLTRTPVEEILRKPGFRRHATKLSRLQGIEVHHWHDVRRIERELPDFFEQHIRRWEQKGPCSLFLNADQQVFYRTLVRELGPTGSLIFSVVKVGGRPAASHIGFFSRGDLLWYKPTFDIALARYSPGQYLVRELLMYAASHGLRALDLTRGDEEFKNRLANDVRRNVNFTWARAARLAATIELGSRIVGRASPRRLVRRTRHVEPAPGFTAAALVLDAHSRAAVEAIQSLGRAGVMVDAASTDPSCVAFSSRFLRHRLRQAPDTTGPGFLDWLRTVDGALGYTLVIPSTEASLLQVNELPEDAPLRIKSVLPSAASLRLALSKAATVELARSLDIKVPSTRVLRAVADLDEFSGPVVLKPIRSSVEIDGSRMRLEALVASDAAARLRYARRWLQYTPILEQEYVPGIGVGVECLYAHGRCVNTFVHERVHEYPLTGGGSSYRRSLAPDASLTDPACRLLDALSWHGVAMVEFKRTQSGELWLMEVNPRLWGSLALPIDCGVDFVRGLWLIATGQDPPTLDGYRTGYYTRYLPLDVEWMKANLRADRSDPHQLTCPPLKAAFEYLRPLAGRESWDHFALDDLGPTSYQVRSLVHAHGSALRQRLRRRSLRRRLRRRHAEIEQRLQREGLRSVCFVCLGNICRSPFAHQYARQRLAGVAVSSVGLDAKQGNRPPEHVVECAASFGVEISSWSPVQATLPSLGAANLIVVMDMNNYEQVLRRFPTLEQRTTALGLFLGSGIFDIPDPLNLDDQSTRDILNMIRSAIDSLRSRVPEPPAKCDLAVMASCADR